MDGKTPAEIALRGTDGGMHARLAQGLREAARFIENYPELPIPNSVEIHYCIPASTDKDGEDEAYRIAGILGSHVTGDDDTSEASRHFGPVVSYSAMYISLDRMAAYNAHMAPYHAARIAKREGQAAA